MSYWGDFVVPATLASPADFQNWTGAAGPANIVQILRACSRIVLDATAGAYYPVDATTGLSTDVQTLNAMRDATCIQASAWVALGVDPALGGIISKSGAPSTKKIGSAAIQYDTSGSALAAVSRANAYAGLVPDAEMLLRQNNLLGHIPWTLG